VTRSADEDLPDPSTDGPTGHSAGDPGAHEGARGIVRRIDHLGRVVVPVAYRKVFAIRDGDLLDMTIDGDAIAIRKLERSCVFCGATSDLGLFRGRLLCARCHDALRS
jgi:AbrB family transcriptional regulator, transcriptional pleiotropic regulator of transition state genes